jgi:CRP/FNR family transcriptional regulator, cyclic AMP receptor protein
VCVGTASRTWKNTPYGLEIVDNRQACKIKRQECFCNLSPAVLKQFSAISQQTTFPADATLFVEGQDPRGGFSLCTGKVKLSTSSPDGKVLILKKAGAGEMLELSAAISRTEYEQTAETAMPCQVNFVPREPLLDLLARLARRDCARRRR